MGQPAHSGHLYNSSIEVIWLVLWGKTIDFSKVRFIWSNCRSCDTKPRAPGNLWRYGVWKMWSRSGRKKWTAEVLYKSDSETIKHCNSHHSELRLSKDSSHLSLDSEKRSSQGSQGMIWLRLVGGNSMVW